MTDEQRARFVRALETLEQILHVDLPDILAPDEIDIEDHTAVAAFVGQVRHIGGDLRQLLLSRTEAGFYHAAQMQAVS